MIDLFDTSLEKPRSNFIACKPHIRFSTLPCRVVKKIGRNVIVELPADSDTSRDIFEIETFFENGIRAMWGVWKGELCSHTLQSIAMLNQDGNVEVTLNIQYQNGTLRVLETSNDEYKKLDVSKLTPGQQVVIEVVVSGAWVQDSGFGIRCHALSFEFQEPAHLAARTS